MKIYKQIKLLCLFVVFSLGSLVSAQAQDSPPNLWAAQTVNGVATVNYPQYVVYGVAGQDGGIFASPVSGDLVIPETVMTVNGEIFNLGTGIITSFNFQGPYTVTEIDLSSMSDVNRAGITSVSIPNTVTTIGSIANCKNMTSIVIPSSVTAIRSNAFQNDSSLVSVTIPETVATMGGNVFLNCTSLESANILNSTIFDYQFSNCTALKDVTISNNVSNIGANVFGNCPSVETLTVPTSVTSINGSSFSGLTGLKNLNYYAKTVSVSFSGLPIENLDLTGVETIANFAFQNCTELKTVILSESLTTIGQSAFQSDSSLVSVTIPSSVTTPGFASFKSCTSLESAVILNSTIAGYEFSNCTALKDVTLSNNVTTISGYAFENCPSVETLTVPASLTSGNLVAFSGLTGLKNLNFYANRVTGSNFNGLPIVNLDLTGVQTIDLSAFQNCTQLKNLILSDSMKTIGQSAFQNCTDLQAVTVGWQTPLSVPTNVFANVNTVADTLYVPAGTAALYQAAPVWKDFGTIIELAAPITPVLSVSPDSLNFAATGGEQTFTISSNTDWTVSNTSSWLTVSPASGNSDSTITVAATANTATTQRTATITVSGTEVDAQVISITQDAAPNLDSIAVNNAKAIIEAASYTVSQDTANTEPTIAAWLVEQINTLTGMSDTGITVTADDITLDSFNPALTGNGHFTFTVSLTKGSNQATASNTGTITFTMPAFVPVTNITDVPTATTAGESLALTGTIEPANATNQTIVWSIKDAGTTGAAITAGNILTATAEGTVTVEASIINGTAEGTDFTQDFPITVTAAPITPTLSVETASLNFAASGEEQTFAITSNTDWTVSSSDSWLTVSPASGSNDGTVTVTAVANSDTIQRTATITVSGGTEVAPQTIIVTQDAKEVPSVIPDETQPVGTDGNGIINLSLSVPSGATVTGSFEITFPEGMTLNEELTVLSVELSGNFSLSFTYEENNTWMITIRSNALRSSTATEYQNIMNIAYTVNDSVAKGTYDATIKNLDFLLSDNTLIKEDLLTVPINVERSLTSIRSIDNATFNAYFINNTLRIESSHAELISIYSVAGKLLYAAKKNEGMIEVPFSLIPGSVYIVEGSVSGIIKVIGAR